MTEQINPLTDPIARDETREALGDIYADWYGDDYADWK